MAEAFEINTETRLCAVIGHPVAHSLSPAMHNAAFRAAGLNYAYLAFDVEDVPAFLAGMRAAPSFRGLSVTIPHKVRAMACLDEVDAMAQRVGCVNTVTNENGVLRGSVTDGTGALRALAEAGVSLAGRRVLFLGAGGAVRAVAFAAAEAGPERVTLLGRSREKAVALAADLRRAAEGVDVGEGSLVFELDEALATHDVIINGTPVGMHGHDEGASCVPPERLRPEHAVFDMVYRPRRTRLLQDALMAGCATIEGMAMLLHQAVLQYELWTGLPAPVDVMRRALERGLE